MQKNLNWKCNILITYLFANFIQDISGSSFNQNAKAIQAFKDDPSTDKYHFFRGDDYDSNNDYTLTRYSKYNNPPRIKFE